MSRRFDIRKGLFGKKDAPSDTESKEGSSITRIPETITKGLLVIDKLKDEDGNALKDNQIVGA